MSIGMCLLFICLCAVQGYAADARPRNPPEDDVIVNPGDAPIPDPSGPIPSVPEPDMAVIYDQLNGFLDAAATAPETITEAQVDSVMHSDLYQELDATYGKRKRTLEYIQKRMEQPDGVRAK